MTVKQTIKMFSLFYKKTIKDIIGVAWRKR